MKLTVTVPHEIIQWMDEQIKEGHFANRSHAVQYSILKTKDLIEKGDLKF